LGKAEEVITCLKKHIASHSVPAEVLSDRGTNFMSKAVHEFLSKLGCRKTQTTAYKPSSNGSVEGFHGYMTKAVAAFVNEQHDNWDEHLHSILFAYRVTPMDGLGISPFEVMYGRRPNLPVDLLIGRELAEPRPTTADQHREMVLRNAENIFPAIRQARLDRFTKNQRQDGDIKNRQYVVGDKVYLHYPKGRFRPIGGSVKFAKTNDGPYTITGVRTEGLVYKVRHDATGFVSNVFVGRLIPSESRTWDEVQVSFPAPLNTIPSNPTVFEDKANSGARHMDMSEFELSEDEKVQSEDEEKKWEQPLELHPAPVKLPPKRGKPSKVPIQSDVSDLWPKYSDSAARRRREYTAESRGDLTLVIKKRPRPAGTGNYWSLPQGPGSYYVKTYGTSRESKRLPH